MRLRPGCPRCVPSFPGLAVPRVVSEVRMVAVRVSSGAAGRGAVGVVRHGDPVLVPRLGIRQERGGGVTIMVTRVLTGVKPLVATGTAAPRRRAIVPIPRATSAGRGPVRSAWVVPPLMLGFWLSVGVRGCGEVHLFFRVLLALVLLPSSSTVGFAGGVLSIGGGAHGV